MMKSCALVCTLCLFVGSGISTVSQAATDEEILTSIQSGVEWLAEQQQVDGSWGNYVPTAETCFVLSKLQDRAYELGFSSPFDVAYEHQDKIIAGWEYIFDASRVIMQSPLAVQDHTAGASGTMDDPDTNGNGFGVNFGSPSYVTAVCLLALHSSGTPDRANDGGLDFDGDQSPDTFFEIAQDAADWLAWAQVDGGPGEGSWNYSPLDNQTSGYDGSVGGFVGLGLGLGGDFGVVVPNWVHTEMELAIDNNQCTTPGPTFGGSTYSSPCGWVNEYKTGHLIYRMGFVETPLTDQGFVDAMNYIENAWRDPTLDPGWGYGEAAASNYLAMWSLMKGLSANGIELIDTDGDGQSDDNWYNQEPPLSPPQDFASTIVAQQLADGSWPVCNWGTDVLCTTWALLTLEKKIPVLPGREVESIPIPTLSQWVLVLLLLLIGGTGYWSIRNRT